MHDEVERLATPFEMVGEFHRRFGLTTADDGPPATVDAETFMFRLQFLGEELLELLSAYRAGDLVGVADALSDLEYVVCGTAHMFHIPLDAVTREVHRANMRKVRSDGPSDARSKRGSGLDVVKPEGWTPPDVEGVLEGHEGSPAIPANPRAPASDGCPPVRSSGPYESFEHYRRSMRSLGRTVTKGYDRLCSECRCHPVHRTSEVSVCASCYQTLE